MLLGALTRLQGVALAFWIVLAAAVVACAAALPREESKGDDEAD